MPEIAVNNDNPVGFDIAMRRFRRACEKAGTLSDARDKDAYEKPTTKRKRRKAAAVKRNSKRLSRELTRFMPKKKKPRLEIKTRKFAGAPSTSQSTSASSAVK